MQQETTPQSPRPFRVCEHCGRLTPSNQPQCANCGATSVSAMIEEEEERAERHFAQAYFSRSTPVTYALLGINLAVFLLMYRFGGSEDPAVLVAFGAKTNELLDRGEWFRLITPIFIHGGLLHIFSNSYVLWGIGPQVEKLYGSARFLLIYLLAGVGGVAGSYFGSQMSGASATTPSVGASGAIFGLFGVLAVFGVRYRNELPAAFRGAFGKSVLPVIAINLFIGFTVPFIDNWAHIGGLVTGAVLTFVVPYLAPGQKRVTPLNASVLLLCAAVVAFCFLQAYQRSGSFLARRGGYGITGYLNGINAASRASNSTFAALADQGNKPAATTALDEAQAALEKAQGLDEESEAIRLALLRQVVEQRTLLAAARPAPDKVEALATESNELQRRLERWARGEGGKYGLRVGESKEEK